MGLVTRLLLSVLLALGLSTARADNLLMARSPSAFPEAMLALKTAIAHRGYTVSRVQRVDVGLKRSGYQTDKYRIVFFGKPAEVRRLVQSYPQLAPYLPLKITIFAEQDVTLLTTFDPAMLRRLVPGAEMAGQLAQWKTDVLAIFDDMREGE
jgi:uncharacterized protein (DUF302 family)